MRLTPGMLHLPWGRGTWTTGDAALMYMTASTMIRFGWFTHNPDVGYPFGMDLGNFPFPEIHQWALLRVVTAFTDDPFVALNVFFLLGFFAVGFFSFLLFDATVRHRWLALILAVVLATLPWHYSRFHHTLLADYSPVPIALLLAHGMWSGGWSGSVGGPPSLCWERVYIGTRVPTTRSSRVSSSVLSSWCASRGNVTCGSGGATPWWSWRCPRRCSHRRSSIAPLQSRRLWATASWSAFPRCPLVSQGTCPPC